MKKMSKKGVLLLAAALAFCAFAIPSMASASWTVVGTHHTLDSPDFGFTSTTALGTINSRCTSSSVTANVASSANLEITGAAFGGDCTLIVNGAAVCTTTSTALGLPWTATVLRGIVQIHGITVTLKITQSSVGNCPAALVGEHVHTTGTLIMGSYMNPTREWVFNNGEGLSMSSIVGVNPVTTRGTFRDTQQTLLAD